jgi:hypothetical protein
MKPVSLENWWNRQLEIGNNNVLPLFSWSQQSKEAKTARKSFDVTKTEEELKGINLGVSLEQATISEEVLQRYWNYFKDIKSKSTFLL